MDTFKEEVYGKIQWECCRAKIYIVAMSLFYVLICATIITYAMEYGNILCSGSLCILLFCMENQQAAHTGSTRMREEAPRIGSMVIFKFGLRLFFQIFIHAYRIFRDYGCFQLLGSSLYRCQSSRRNRGPACSDVMRFQEG